MKGNEETWQQDPVDLDLWLGENGVLLNTAALTERAYYFDIVKLPAPLDMVVETEAVSEHAV